MREEDNFLSYSSSEVLVCSFGLHLDIILLNGV